MLQRPHLSIVRADLSAILLRAAVTTAEQIAARVVDPDLGAIAPAPAGWSDDELLAESMAAFAGG
ncbi:hypothetical protein [uncultured Jatrophihabitans sp.]|uniref:hypothetical protein n=1 Tax=uncultured Jatrophihabitans sp. TaxID=1610747 RepID=UPI0035C9981F